MPDRDRARYSDLGRNVLCLSPLNRVLNVDEWQQHSADWYRGRLELVIELLRLADDFNGIGKWQQVLSNEVERCIRALKRADQE